MAFVLGLADRHDTIMSVIPLKEFSPVVQNIRHGCLFPYLEYMKQNLGTSFFAEHVSHGTITW